MVASTDKSHFESNGDGRIDIYVRMNQDCEKDYCFNVPEDEPVSQLYSIFDSLPMVLSPCYFYNPRPIGFFKVTDPGFLTSEGGLLFPETIKNKKVLRMDEPLGKQVIEGQLIEPKWEWNYTRWITVITVLSAWLYLDLPQFITPTPGIAPSTLAFKGIDKVMELFGINEISNLNFSPENDEAGTPFSSIPWQIGFFVFHILKVLVVYGLFWAGGINPYSFNPMESRKLRLRVLNRDKLLSIGWTGCRRATKPEWSEENRKNLIERHGGIVRAYNAGVLGETSKLGVQLDKGEGWDSDSKFTGSWTPVKVNDVYFHELKVALGGQISEITTLLEKDKENEDGAGLDEEGASQAIDTCVKRFRRIGPVLGTKKLHEIYQARKSAEEELLKQQQKKK